MTIIATGQWVSDRFNPASNLNLKEGTMPRGIYNRSSKKTEHSLITTSAFTSQKWWSKLNNVEQKEVMSEGQQLAAAMIANVESRIAIGQHLSRLQEILTPYGVFQRFLRNFQFSLRTAARYIAAYKNAKAGLPEKVLKAAVARGVNIMGENEAKPFGQYTEVVKNLPPPTQATDEQANAYVDAILNARKQQRSNIATEAAGGMGVVIPQDPGTLLKECYRFVSLRFARLPQNVNTRKKWTRQFVGMVLTLAGEPALQFTPVPVPEDFTVSRGRPRNAVAAA
jgi:hypothetical protein